MISSRVAEVFALHAWLNPSTQGNVLKPNLTLILSEDDEDGK